MMMLVKGKVLLLCFKAYHMNHMISFKLFAFRCSTHNKFSQGKIYDDYWGDTGLSAMANGAEYEDPSNSLSGLVNEPTAPPAATTTEAPSRVVEGEKGGKKKKKDKKKKPSGGSSGDCDSACKKKMKKIKKIEKKCKANPKLNVCKKLPALKGDLGGRTGPNDDRNGSFEVIDPDLFYPNFDEKCE